MNARNRYLDRMNEAMGLDPLVPTEPTPRRAMSRPDVSHWVDSNENIRIALHWDGLTIEMFDDAAAIMARCILDEIEGADHDR